MLPLRDPILYTPVASDEAAAIDASEAGGRGARPPVGRLAVAAGCGAGLAVLLLALPALLTLLLADTDGEGAAVAVRSLSNKSSGAAGPGRAGSSTTNRSDRPGREDAAELTFWTTPIDVDQFLHDAFPGDLYDYWKQWKPGFSGVDRSTRWNCAVPWPGAYFDNANSSSWKLFHDRQTNFPMAMDYMDTSGVLRPRELQKQVVLGFADMQWAYFHYNGDLESDSPYLVLSMAHYADYLNYEFVECGLLGWPGYPQFSQHLAGAYTIRVVLKNGWHGEECSDAEAGHAWCNLRTSWGAHPKDNNWRFTVKEITEVCELCTYKYACDIQKVSIAAPAGEQAPQVFLFRVVGPASTTSTTTSTSTTTITSSTSTAAAAAAAAAAATTATRTNAGAEIIGMSTGSAAAASRRATMDPKHADGANGTHVTCVWRSFGSDTECRLDEADDTLDARGTALLRWAPSLDSCKRLCIGQRICAGVEYRHDQGWCEIWSQPVGHYKRCREEDGNWTCGGWLKHVECVAHDCADKEMSM